ncbi:MAG: ribosome small subunit-dependent GTPase A [Myxococcales bacterium]|nr:ribosome small subunit-dependent GTPase A [Myxococcales bacterium]MCB9525069.1 ribosome small subunit-dependent GTPase A [Myxococcales bacterium]
MNLEALGFGPHWAAALLALDRPDWTPARVVADHRDQPEVVTASGPRRALLRPHLYQDGTLPVVGDWVAVSQPAPDVCMVEAILPPRTDFARIGAGRRAARQRVAANVDRVLVVTALDGDFKPRRLDRYLAAVHHAGAEGAVVLNKTDACPGGPAAVAEAVAAVKHRPCLPVSAQRGEGLAELRALLGPGETVALVGSSGVGKSSLINALLGEARQATQAVRADDGKGRHTTTHRSLIPLPGGALLVDTPGMRAFAPDAGAEDVAAVFPDVAEWAARCHFADCSHEGEPGCAVQAAVAAGALAAERLDAWRRLGRAQAHDALRADAHAQRAAQRAQAKLYRRILASSRRHKGDG